MRIWGRQARTLLPIDALPPGWTVRIRELSDGFWEYEAQSSEWPTRRPVIGGEAPTRARAIHRAVTEARNMQRLLDDANAPWETLP